MNQCKVVGVYNTNCLRLFVYILFVFSQEKSRYSLIIIFYCVLAKRYFFGVLVKHFLEVTRIYPFHVIETSVRYLIGLR